jgi:riboflavin kinase/FMN adenylyltransferase
VTVQIFSGIESVPVGFGPSAVTIGKFDGLHTGHRVVIEDLLNLAGDDLEPVVVTFDRNPLQLLRPDKSPPPLVGLDQKLELLESVGVAATLVLRFDEELSSLEPEAFVERVLLGPLAMRRLLVGDDFRFGHFGRGDVQLLERMGAERGFTVQVQQQVTKASRRVSSTWIRELLGAGAIREATELLGRPPAVRGEVVHGAHRGRELGFPTANLAQQSDGMIPADGVYAGRLVDRSLDPPVSYPAAISVGSNPTFEGVPPKQVEAYVLDETLDLYGHVVDVEFTHRIRGQVAYTGIQPLIAQIAVDVDQVRSLAG